MGYFWKYVVAATIHSQGGAGNPKNDKYIVLPYYLLYTKLVNCIQHVDYYSFLPFNNELHKVA